jgi:hypothetical protein
MRIQLREYIAFIRNFIEGSDIMTKTFYVVVPFTPGTVVSKRPVFHSDVCSGFQKGTAPSKRRAFSLSSAWRFVAGGLAQSGLRAVPLGTEEIIELLYRSFNLGDMDNPIPYTQHKLWHSLIS